MARVLLRKVRLSDCQFFAKWWKDRILMHTLGIKVRAGEKTVNKRFSKIAKYEKDKKKYVILGDSHVIGYIRLRKQEDGWYELGIFIGDRRFWGKGYGTKAINLILRQANQQKIKHIYLETRPDNKRAIKAFEKNGFREVALKEDPTNKYIKKMLRMELIKK